MNGFRGLPNQKLIRTFPSKLRHERGSIFIPLSIDGNSATYFFDTGAWVSCMSESETKRLHLQIRNSSGTLGQMAGSQVGFRTAVAHNVVVGNTQFGDVSFAIFPDNQEPWSDLPPGRKGIIGIPLLVSMRNVRWTKDGVVELSKKSPIFDIQASNLTFDDDHLVVAATVENREVSATVDTGATTTDLYKPFADKFEGLLKQSSTKESTDVHGVGHAEKFDSVALPKVKIRIAKSDVLLSPARVILKSLGANCCIGNFGLDLFKQADAFEIDFDAMTLRLISAEKIH
jgi:predicted aspartyl protease